MIALGVIHQRPHAEDGRPLLPADEVEARDRNGHDSAFERPEAVGRAGHDPLAPVGLERELEAVRGGNHRRRAFVDGMNDLGVVDSA